MNRLPPGFAEIVVVILGVGKANLNVGGGNFAHPKPLLFLRA